MRSRWLFMRPVRNEVSMMRKKFILFIVEGYNDEMEINAMLHSPWFDNYRLLYEPYFYHTNGDVLLSQIRLRNKRVKVTADNVLSAIDNIIQDFRKTSGPYSNIRVSDIQEVVQITDTDGTFIPKYSVIRDDEYVYATYFDNCIKINNVDGIVGRNRRKADIIRRLLQVKQIGGIPYSLYYVSCNMDHVLFNDGNLSREAKKNKSKEFALTCRKDPGYLSQSLFKSGIMANGSYEESWEEIQGGLNSLGRYTNFNLFFTDKAKNPK